MSTREDGLGNNIEVTSTKRAFDILFGRIVLPYCCHLAILEMYPMVLNPVDL